MGDNELRLSVIDELEFDPSVNSSNIGVIAAHGIVTLTGHVSDYAQKTAAERAVRRVKGVKAIVQEIQVRFASNRSHDDDEIARRAVNVLGWNVVVPRDSVRVKIQNGWVTLSGEVDWNYQREAAVSSVRKLAGVAGVVNEMSLKPTTQAGDVKQRIMDALKRHAEIEASHIQINVRDGCKVDIGGGVANWDERHAVIRAAWSAPGVQSVNAHLRIGEAPH